MDQRLVFPATARNRDPIAEALSSWLPSRGTVLEIASGSGEHAVAFQQHFPDLTWQASDCEPAHCASISAWINHCQLAGRMPQPLRLDVLTRPWPLPQPLQRDVAAVVAINLIHIAPWSCCKALIEEASALLHSGHPLVLYGPFQRNGTHTSPSNAAFDASLRQRCPSWGVRHLEEVQSLASACGLRLHACRKLPANNLAVAFQR